MKPGEQKAVVLMTDPSPARISSYEYISESSDIAGVNDYGVITAAAPGETTVRIRTFSPGEDGPESVVCETEVTVIVEEEVPETIIYTAVNNNVLWKKGSSEGITITVKRSPEDETCFSHFESFRIDDAVFVKDKDYTAAKGSTVIAVSPSALSSLSAGNHSFTVLFDDGRASGKLTATEEKKTVPDTSDSRDSSTVLILGGSLLIAAAAFGIRKYSKDR